MSRIKTGESSRGKALKLPDWWLDALRRACRDRTISQLTDDLNATIRRESPFRRERVGDFLSGKVTTDLMMHAFLALFPELPPPVFHATSYEEAHQLQQVRRRYEDESVAAVRGPGRPRRSREPENFALGSSDSRKVTEETIEDIEGTSPEDEVTLDDEVRVDQRSKVRAPEIHSSSRKVTR